MSRIFFFFQNVFQNFFWNLIDTLPETWMDIQIIKNLVIILI